MKLGELGELNRGKSRHRPRDAAFLYGGSYPFIQTGDIKASRGKIISHSQTYSEAGLAQSRLWPKDTMVITIAANIAETAILDYPACFPDSVVGFIANLHKADVRFVEYAFRLLKKRIQHENVGTGSVQDNINLEILNRLEISVPELAEQKAVASILSALDDKIELNRQMNETLEAMARAIFKDWFVDFGPTRAKMAGLQRYLVAELWHLFPERMNEDGNPKGWQLQPLLHHAALLSGGTPKTEELAYWNGPVAWASAKDVSQCSEMYLISTERSITDRGLQESATGIIPKHSTAIVARGATTGRNCLFGSEMAMNQTCYALSSSKGRPFWLNCAFNSVVDSLIHGAHGSVFDTITTSTFQGVEIVVSEDIILDVFEETVRPLFLKALANIEESRSLSATRDLLLPKLMSGEIPVKEARQVAERTLANTS